MPFPNTTQELHALGDNEFIVTFLLTGDVAELLPQFVCGVELITVRMVEEDRPYLSSVFPDEVPSSWFDPGLYGLTIRSVADDTKSAVRSAWEAAKPAARFLATYIRLPRPGFDLQRQRHIAPTGWVIVWNRDAWQLTSYQTWLLMTISIGAEASRAEADYDDRVFRRLADASNAFWAANQRKEDRLRIQRATTWFALSETAGEYASKLLHGWMAIVPLVIDRREHADRMISRMVRLARRHGHHLDRGLLVAIRAARNEIAHEGSMANSDPLAVDAARVAQYLHPIRLLFLMALLFILEMTPMERPLLDKWRDVEGYQPSIVLDDRSIPLWHPVVELFGSLE